MTMASDRHCKFAMTCVQCSNELFFPERCEHRDESHFIYLWRCPKCDCCFEVISPADTKSIEKIMRSIEAILTRDGVLSSRLAAHYTAPADHAYGDRGHDKRGFCSVRERRVHSEMLAKMLDADPFYC